MTLEKAIEIGEDLLTDGPHFPPNARRDAVKLLIQAGIRVTSMRISPCTTADKILPGETEN